MADDKTKGAIGLSRTDLMEAVSEGVYRGIWAIAYSATQMPGTDFYAAVQDGVERAMKAVKQ